MWIHTDKVTPDMELNSVCGGIIYFTAIHADLKVTTTTRLHNPVCT